MFTKEEYKSVMRSIIMQENTPVILLTNDNDYVRDDLELRCSKCNTKHNYRLETRSLLDSVNLECPVCSDLKRISRVNVCLN
jgi:hypothetical protein